MDPFDWLSDTQFSCVRCSPWRYVCIRVGHKIQPLHRDLQWSIVLVPEGKVIPMQCYYSYLCGTKNKLASSYQVPTFPGFKTRYSKCYEDISDRMNTTKDTSDKLYTCVQNGGKIECRPYLAQRGNISHLKSTKLPAEILTLHPTRL
jgi:hypothetical protein